MEKGFYIHIGSKTAFLGVEKKVLAQIKALSQEYDVDRIVIEKEESNIIKSILWRLPGGSWGAKYEDALDEIKEKANGNKVHFFYIRAQVMDRKYMHFLSKIRGNYPDAKVVFELPTYPYDRELFQNGTMWPWFFKDRHYRKQLKKYVDRLVTFSEDDYIWGIKTIRIINGIGM